MKVIEHELSVFVDCDDTLVMWNNPTVAGPDKLDVRFAGKTVYLTPHQYHIDLVKMYKERGYYVTVWSANGWRHAKQVCEVLNLQDYVDVVQVKPTKYMDDNPNPGSILGPRVYEDDLTKPVFERTNLIEYVVDPIAEATNGAAVDFEDYQNLLKGF